MSASKIFKIGTAIMLAGMVGLTVAATGKFVVVLFMVVFSLGEHMIMPVKSTLTMDLAKKESGGMALGISGSINQLGSIAGLIIVTGLFAFFSRFVSEYHAVMPFKIILAVSAAFMVGAGDFLWRAKAGFSDLCTLRTDIALWCGYISDRNAACHLRGLRCDSKSAYWETH
ncbi:hypothetical protein ACH6CV_13065 [Bacillota bacterium Meth-B3]